jgi:hypothetical protein
MKGNHERRKKPMVPGHTMNISMKCCLFNALTFAGFINSIHFKTVTVATMVITHDYVYDNGKGLCSPPVTLMFFRDQNFHY